MFLQTMLAFMLLGEIPQGTGPTVQTPGEKPTAAPGADPTPGVTTSSDVTGQPSPTLHQIVDTEFYVLDPNKPKERVLGKRVKELQALAAQFNTAQSRIHNAENGVTELQTENASLKEQLKKLTDGAYVEQKLKELGINVQDPNPAPLPATVPGQQFMTPEQIALQNGVGQTDAWGNPIASPNPVPSTVPQQQATITPENLPLLVAAFKEALQPDLQGMLEKLQSQATQNDQERSLKEQTGRYFADAFTTKVNNLVSSGIDQVEATRIATIENSARDAERQAEELFKVTGPQRAQAIQTATSLMDQVEKDRADASVARSNAVTLAAEAKTKQEAIDLLETDSFVGVSRENLLTGDPNDVRRYKDTEIEKAKKDNLETAVKIAEESERVRQSAGLM